MRGLEGIRQHFQVEQLGEARVEQLFFHTAGDVRRKMTGVERLQILRTLVVTEHALVNRLEEQAGGHRVEGRVVLHVLQGDLNDRLVELLGGDAVEQRQLELARDLRDPGDVFIETGTGVLDCQVDFIRVIRLTLSIALDYGDCHVCFPSCAPQRDRNSMRKPSSHDLRPLRSKGGGSAV